MYIWAIAYFGIGLLISVMYGVYVCYNKSAQSVYDEWHDVTLGFMIFFWPIYLLVGSAIFLGKLIHALSAYIIGRREDVVDDTIVD